MKTKIRLVTLCLGLLLLLCDCDVPYPGENSTTKPESSTSAEPQITQKEENEVQTTEVQTTEAQTTAAVEAGAEPYKAINYDDFKAMWISQFDLQNIYAVGGAQRSETTFKAYIKKILANVKGLGINTVIIQVRPYADSMYPSDYYPMSSVVVGSYGKEAVYDPFEIMVEEAHSLELSVQAWINPIRGMLNTEITAVDNKYQMKKWYNDSSTKGKYVVNVASRWYLNPAYEEARKLIIDGAREILEKYDVDGLHMDDYFYPTTDASFDSAAYSAYVKGGGRDPLADWRRTQLNLLVGGLYSMVKEYDKDVLFGISPAGNFNTVYDSHYADIYEWCGTAGYIDYICPQVYFGMEHGSYDFVKVSTKYQSMIKTDSVKLVIGMSLGKAMNGYDGKGDTYAGTGKNEWIDNRDVLYRELQYTEKLDKCMGVAYFCYQYFYNPVSGAEIKQTADERAKFLPLFKTISWTK